MAQDQLSAIYSLVVEIEHLNFWQLNFCKLNFNWSFTFQTKELSVFKKFSFPKFSCHEFSWSCRKCSSQEFRSSFCPHFTHFDIQPKLASPPCRADFTWNIVNLSRGFPCWSIMRRLFKISLLSYEIVNIVWIFH